MHWGGGGEGWGKLLTEVVLQGTGVAREGTDDEHAREREKKSGENPRRHQAHE